jgi:hypothetical protein
LFPFHVDHRLTRNNIVASASNASLRFLLGILKKKASSSSARKSPNVGAPVCDG